MQTTPDLVFLNCCHLGSMRPVAVATDSTEAERPWRPDQFAGSISRRLIENGVRAVVAAGWAVDDEKARIFAETFYGQLLNGDDLGRRPSPRDGRSGARRTATTPGGPTRCTARRHSS